jgi:hypothetical protein
MTESEGKKGKSGYYIAVNFDRWPEIDVTPTKVQIRPKLRRVRFGWIDHSDWLAQASATGQQSSLPAIVENLQLLTFFEQS